MVSCPFKDTIYTAILDNTGQSGAIKLSDNENDTAEQSGAKQLQECSAVNKITGKKTVK